MPDAPREPVEIPKLLRGIVCGVCLGTGVQLQELADVVRRVPCRECEGRGFGIVASGALKAEIDRQLDERDRLEQRHLRPGSRR